MATFGSQSFSSSDGTSSSSYSCTDLTLNLLSSSLGQFLTRLVLLHSLSFVVGKISSGSWEGPSATDFSSAPQPILGFLSALADQSRNQHRTEAEQQLPFDSVDSRFIADPASASSMTFSDSDRSNQSQSRRYTVWNDATHQGCTCRLLFPYCSLFFMAFSCADKEIPSFIQNLVWEKTLQVRHVLISFWSCFPVSSDTRTKLDSVKVQLTLQVTSLQVCFFFSGVRCAVCLFFFLL